VEEPVIPTDPETTPENGIFEPVIFIPGICEIFVVKVVEPVIDNPVEPVILIAGICVIVNADEPVIPTEPDTTPENGIVEPVIEIPTEPVTLFPTSCVIFVDKVVDPVIPTEPEIAVPTKLVGIVVEPVILNPIEPVTFTAGIWETLTVNVDEPVIPTLPLIAVPTKLTGSVEDPVIDNPIEPVILFPIEPVSDLPISVVTFTGKVDEPVIPTEPLTTAPPIFTLQEPDWRASTEILEPETEKVTVEPVT